VHAASTAAKSSPAPALPLPDKPSIAVLSFVNMSGDPEQEYFADGIGEDVITLLSKSRGLFVRAASVTWHFSLPSMTVRSGPK
jgi:adenylate cyclase